MSRSITAVVVALSLPLLTGCAGLGVSNSQSSQTPSYDSLTPDAAEPSNSAADAAAAAPSAASSSASPSTLTKKFGSTFTWDDGVELTVGKPAPFTPSMTAFPSEPGVVMDVTMKNGSKAPLNPFMVSMQATSGDQQAEQIFDSENNIGGPSASILPGRTLKYKIAFTKPAGNLTLQVDYGFGNAQGFYE